MGSTNPSEWTTQPPKAADHPMQLESWHCVDFNEPTIQRLSQSQQLARHEPADFAYSAVQHDFERRLSRFGITISETSNNTASNASDKPIPFFATTRRCSSNFRQLQSRRTTNALPSTGGHQRRLPVARCSDHSMLYEQQQGNQDRGCRATATSSADRGEDMEGEGRDSRTQPSRRIYGDHGLEDEVRGSVQCNNSGSGNTASGVAEET